MKGECILYPNRPYFNPRPSVYNPTNVYYQSYQTTVQPYWLQQSQPQTLQPPSFYNPYPTPYPKPTNFAPIQQKGIHSMMNSFKKTDGNLDFNKMVDTAGQLMGTMNQLSSLFKGVTSIFK